MLLSVLEELLINRTDSIGHSGDCCVHSLAHSVSEGGHELLSHAADRSPNIATAHYGCVEKYCVLIRNKLPRLSLVSHCTTNREDNKILFTDYNFSRFCILALESNCVDVLQSERHLVAI